MPTSDQPSRSLAAAGGVACAALALGAGELAAGLARSWRSPLVAVAETVIDEAPQPMVEFGKETFGTNDKVALIIGTLVILTGVAAAVGIAARRRRIAAPIAFGIVGLIGLVASAAGSATLVDGIPSIVAALVGTGALLGLHSVAGQAIARGATGGITIVDATDADATDADAPATVAGDASAADRLASLGRRPFVLGTAAFAAVGALAAAGGRALAGRFSAAQSRDELVLAQPTETLAPAGDGVSFAEPADMTSFYTSNADFYRIDTALTVPQVPVEGWTLSVTGMVDDEYSMTFDELEAMGLREYDITLTCVSNQIGGGLVGNARWLGVPLAEILDRAGVDPAADQVVGRSVDDYTCGFPVEAAYDRDAIVAVGMNGEPLPLEHGFPARLVTPGLYGYVSATKWLREIELTTFADFDHYWVPRGYAAEAPIKTMARLDVPGAGGSAVAGRGYLAGVAWAQTRGISKVEVKIGDADFAEAELADPLGNDTWRQWRFAWEPEPGIYNITVRATDGDGVLQTEERAAPLPDGASGWHSVLVNVRAA